MQNQTLKQIDGEVTPEEAQFFGQGYEAQHVKAKLVEQMKPHAYVVKIKFESGKNGTVYYGFDPAAAENKLSEYLIKQ